MKSIYNNKLKAHVSLDDENKIRYINHTQEYWEGETNNPVDTAGEYLESTAEIFRLKPEQLKNLKQYVSYYDPREQDIEFRLSDEKRYFDSITYGYYQTLHNVPVWGAGLSVTVKENPSRVVYSANTSEEKIQADLPARDIIDKYKKILATGKTDANGKLIKKPFVNEETGEADPSADFIRQLLQQATEKKSAKAKGDANNVAANDNAGLIRGRFFMYKYEARKRYGHEDPAPNRKDAGPTREETDVHPTLDLPPVNEKIKEGQYYLVAEITFSYTTPEFGHMVWLALVELETASILYLEPLGSGVNGLVFTYDPITSTGVLTNTANQTDALLNPLRDDVLLSNLNAPVAGVQNLRGTYVNVTNVEDPNIAAPTNPSGTDFDYNVRTNNFGAVNAYYHADRLFATISELGFPISTYFNGTTFPVPIDHRDMGNEVNAHCIGNGAGGIGHAGYGLGDAGDLVNPICRAVDKWVHWHEMGGHGVLYEHVNSANFGFAHSAGDGLAALQNDPESALRALPERFRYAPFRAGLDRFFNRAVTMGWGWGGSNDVGGYNSEQILATTHFRIYRSIGGDAADINRRWHASRVTTYLILRAISTLTPATNPGNALGFYNALAAVDLLNWTSEGLYGGAYNKLIRWSFEKQGLFQAPGTPVPVNQAGAPPAVDVYINDGRNGEYEYKYDHWNNTSAWNRTTADGLTGHQSAILGATNYMYVKVKNRGTSMANNVVVKGYHCLPGAGLTWPTDFTQMTPLAGLTAATINPNNSEEVILGPFEWIPNVNAYGHDCVLMIASTAGDPSNIDNFTAGETIQEWRLVPHDNNIAQRNIQLIPGAGGMEGLKKGLHEYLFYAGNNLRKKATMELKVSLPAYLQKGGWQIQFDGIDNNRFTLKAGEKRKIVIKVAGGQDFTRDQVLAATDNDIAVTLYADGMLMGGMTYRVDPDLKVPANPIDKSTPAPHSCKDKAADLLHCLNLGGNKVKKVCVKKVSLDIEMENDCKCDD